MCICTICAHIPRAHFTFDRNKTISWAGGWWSNRGHDQALGPRSKVCKAEGLHCKAEGLHCKSKETANLVIVVIHASDQAARLFKAKHEQTQPTVPASDVVALLDGPPEARG